jgi:LacI family transcriptional regulator
MKKITRKDVAKKAGVSTAVVSYVINQGPRPISRQTREKVLAAIQELGYRANNVARSLTSKTTRIIGLLIPDSANAFFSEVAKGVEDAAFARGYRVILCNTHSDVERQAQNIDALISQMVDGIVMITTPPVDSQLALLEQYDIPVVLVDPEKEKDEPIHHQVGLVTVNGAHGGSLAAHHLLSKGHTKIAILTDSPNISPSAERVAGFVEALQENGLQPELVLLGDRLPDGYQATRRLLESPHPPTAIFACNDMLAIGAIRCASDFKVRIPEDLAIIGYDDIIFASFTTPRLTTIHQPKYQMGEVATRMLLDHIDQRKQDQDLEDESYQGISQTIRMEVELVIREST